LGLWWQASALLQDYTIAKWLSPKRFNNPPQNSLTFLLLLAFSL
jgi:hypothetical protein